MFLSAGFFSVQALVNFSSVASSAFNAVSVSSLEVDKPSFELTMQEVESKFMEGVSKHKRSNSEPVKRKLEKDEVNKTLQAPYRLKMEMGRYFETMEMHPTSSDVQSYLSQEILDLRKQLQNQFSVRHALENALSYRPLSPDATTENSLPKSTTGLIKEIAVLEQQVVHLERHLLSLYRKTFDQQISSESNVAERLNSSPLITRKGVSAEVPGQDVTQENDNTVTSSNDLLSPRHSTGNLLKECNDILDQQKLLDSSIHRCYSSLSQHSTCSIRTSPRTKSRAKAVDSYHSLPFSMLEQSQSATTSVYPMEHYETYFSDHVPETPNSISEEMIKCISAIYCELADPPVIDHDDSCSPITSSSTYDFSSHSQGTEEMSRPYSRMLKVEWICRDTDKLEDVELTLKKFRSLIHRLEGVDLRKMKHEEKLAFWINVHNTLVMHAFLIYGIPQNNLKRVSMPLKAAYSVGGHTISVDMIQRSILGCRLPRPGQWLRLLFSMKTKFKVGDARKVYAIEHPEPLLHFALCSGSHSDPAVRMYTSKGVFEELETAKEEYIQSNFLVHKEQKILLPKIVESFAKDSGLCSADLHEEFRMIMNMTLRFLKRCPLSQQNDDQMRSRLLSLRWPDTKGLGLRRTLGKQGGWKLMMYCVPVSLSLFDQRSCLSVVLMTLRSLVVVF
ncbi:hypothetical protein C1H46_037754 [Malus baccata]|uniref:DUF547 domain-containing protein n=1 Tax=Malus baccata TaxID=106549 RepID=A0A540KR80_MALBA|nr:hypothetical protein C1H46_037754 [Malus baccata]